MNEQERYKQILDRLDYVISECEDHADIEDGDDGFPRPNRWMRMHTELEQLRHLIQVAWHG